MAMRPLFTAISLFLLLTDAHAQVKDEDTDTAENPQPKVDVYSPLSIVSKKNRDPQPEIRLGCPTAEVEAGEEPIPPVKKIIDCKTLQFYLVTGKSVELLNGNTYRWEDFQKSADDKPAAITANIPQKTSGQLWREELRFAGDVSKNEGDRGFREASKFGKKIVTAVTFAVETAFFNTLDGLTYVGSKIHFLNVRKRARMNLAAFNLLVEKPADGAPVRTEEVPNKGFENLVDAIRRLPTPPAPPPAPPAEEEEDRN